MASPDHRPLTLLQSALQSMEASFAALAIGVTSRQWSLLEAIEANQGASQAQLTAITNIDRATMTDLLDKLVAKRYVAKKRSKDDRRVFNVNLTVAGVALLNDRRRDVEAMSEQAWRKAGGVNARLRDGLVRLGDLGVMESVEQ